MKFAKQALEDFSLIIELPGLQGIRTVTQIASVTFRDRVHLHSAV